MPAVGSSALVVSSAAPSSSMAADGSASGARTGGGRRSGILVVLGMPGPSGWRWRGGLWLSGDDGTRGSGGEDGPDEGSRPDRASSEPGAGLAAATLGAPSSSAAVSASAQGDWSFRHQHLPREG